MVSELQVLQYRTTYTNGTSIPDYSSITNTASYGSRLTQVSIAVVIENSETGNTLKFITGDKYSIWPGMLAN